MTKLRDNRRCPVAAILALAVASLSLSAAAKAASPSIEVDEEVCLAQPSPPCLLTHALALIDWIPVQDEMLALVAAARARAGNVAGAVATTENIRDWNWLARASWSRARPS